MLWLIFYVLYSILIQHINGYGYKTYPYSASRQSGERQTYSQREKVREPSSPNLRNFHDFTPTFNSNKNIVKKKKAEQENFYLPRFPVPAKLMSYSYEGPMTKLNDVDTGNGQYSQQQQPQPQPLLQTQEYQEKVRQQPQYPQQQQYAQQGQNDNRKIEETVFYKDAPVMSDFLKSSASQNTTTKPKGKVRVRKVIKYRIQAPENQNSKVNDKHPFHPNKEIAQVFNELLMYAPKDFQHRYRETFPESNPVINYYPPTFDRNEHVNFREPIFHTSPPHQFTSDIYHIPMNMAQRNQRQFQAPIAFESNVHRSLTC